MSSSIRDTITRRNSSLAWTRTLPILLVVVCEMTGIASSTRAQETADLAVASADEKQSAAKVAFFESRIRPVLIERCYECHSLEASVAEGGLRLDDAESLRRGGDSGPGLIPGDPAAGKLMAALRYTTDFYQMPPDGKLPDAVIADFATWIEQGAVDPRASLTGDQETKPAAEIDIAEAREFWAFRPLQPQPAPVVEHHALTRSPIDAWWLKRLEMAGDRPVSEASRAVLLRRATWDLTGLPPAAEELEAFVTDDRPDALERQLDRLLAGPRYGERWGRHWLDVARYADSNGLDENLAYTTAFEYRDWVIRAWNEDLPYDEFVKWQVAGDLLSEEADSSQSMLDRKIATGFLAIGPKMLACDDGRKMELDIIDEQVDTLGKAFLGMTLGCARCHDHKFDPVSQRDYYAMAGIFKSTHTMENFSVVAVWHEHELATIEGLQERERIRAEIAARRELAEKGREAAVQAFEKHMAERGRDYAEAILRRVALGPLAMAEGEWSVMEAARQSPCVTEALETIDGANRIEREAEEFQRGTTTVDREGWGKGIGVLAEPGYAEYDIELPEAGRYQFELRFAAAESRPIQVSLDGTAWKTAAVETTGGWGAEQQRWHAVGVVELSAGKHVLRLERSEVMPHVDRWALLEVPAVSAMTSDEEPILQSLRARLLTDGWRAFWGDAAHEADRAALVAGVRIDAAPLIADLRDRSGLTPDSAIASAMAWLEGLVQTGGAGRVGDDLSRYFEAQELEELAGLEQEIDSLAAQEPKFATAMGVREGTATNLPVQIRGNYLTLGDSVERGWPVALSSETEATLVPQEGASGRRHLADWLVAPERALTARVITNRLWRWHLGAGLVRTPDNFGVLGLPPTHPELLEYLAHDLRQGAWSLKRLHRRLMSSQLYRTSSDDDPALRDKDPENLSWWHVPRRRLSAEEVRDGLLEVSGALDLKMYGKCLPNSPRDYVSGTAQDPKTYESLRRSVYLPVLRSAVYDVLQAFDFPDPAVANGDRATSTIPPQALFALNGKPVIDAADRLADEVAAVGDETTAWFPELTRRVLKRAPTSEELERALAFVAAYQERIAAEAGETAPDPQREVRRALARVLLATNEFVFVD